MPVKKLPPIDEGPNTARIPKRSKYSLGPEDRDPEAVRLQLEAQHIHTASLSSTANRVSFDNSTMLGRAKESGFISLGQTVSEHRTERDAPSASPEKSPAGAFNRTNFQLSPSESYVAAHKDAVAERWRSLLLKLETDMRELVADGVGEPPASSRIMRVIAHFDEFCRTAEGQSSHLADLLRLFRVEFCRAIFSSHHLGMVDDADSDPEVTAYFDQVTTLLRENAMLSSEVALGNTREKAVELAKQVDRLNANVKLYENEIGRLVRLNDHMIEQLRKSKEELDAAKAAAEAKIAANERELQALNVENKDMQLQLFRLRKQVAGGKAKILKDSYQHMKLTKMSLMTTLFSEGDERIGLLVMLSQLESRVNEILDSYDNEYMLSAENAHTDLRRKMANSVAVLLEEMHLCEKNYRRLVPGALSYRTTSEEMDETDGFAAILFDQKIYESFLLRESIRKRLANGGVNVTGIKPYQPISTGEDSGRRGEDGKKGGEERDREMSGTHMAAGGGDLNNSTSLLSQPAAKRKLSLSTSRSAVLPAPFSLPSSGSAAEKLPAVTTERSASMGADMEEIVFMKKNEWIENVFNMSPAEELLKRLLVNVKAEHIVPDKILPNLMMPRLLRHPMHDLSSDKFLWGVDLFAGRDPAIQKFLCTLNYIDPSVPIQLPESSNFLKVKYKSSLHGEHHHEKQVTQQSPLPQPPTQASTHSPLSHRDSYSGFSPPPKPSISLSGTMRQQSPNLRKETPATVKTRPLSVNRALADWGGRTLFGEEKIKDDAEDKKLFNVGENLRVFKELNNPALLKENSSSQQRAGATNSTTAFTVALQRLNPMSPNRAPEWTLYKSLFGGYRALTPRMIEMSTIDHILLNACKGHFTRMEYRYDQCLSEANFRATNNQMAYSIAERFFRENYELTDFQEALVDELEARYGYPELVAKNLYELLCYLDAMGKKDALMNLYLNVIRGFQPPTHIHYICNQLYHLSYCWPCSNPLDEVTREDALTVLRYLYRNTETIVHVDIHEILKDFDMATRNAALTFITMREFLANFMLHQEEPLLLYFNGMFSNLCESDNLQEITFENYDQVISRFWKHREERKSLVRFLAAGLGFNRGPLLSTRDLSFVASSALSSELLS